MNRFKAICLLSILLAFPELLAPSLAAQCVEVSGSAEMFSAYIWRGDYVCGANLTPKINVSWRNFSVQSYAVLPFDGGYKEIGIDCSYTLGPISFHLADYFARYSSSATPDNYFNFRKGSTNHIQEAILCYEPSTMPFSMKWFTFYFGDWLPESDGNPGRPSLSSFLETEAHVDFASEGRLSALCGISFGRGMYTDYTKGFALVHTELTYSRRIAAGPLILPLSVSYIINPYRAQSWMRCSLGIEF